MTCDEFQRVLFELEGSHNPEAEGHLKNCSGCSELVEDLNTISREARLLAEDEEPAARVWNRLAIAMRQEGLIREPRTERAPARTISWSHPWLVPLAASSLVILGLLVYERGGMQPQTAQQAQAPSPAITASLQTEGMPPEQDQQVLKVIEARAPAMRASYESELKAVNAYIRDAELSARSHPNDENAQQYLTNAYEQRAMVYEMAMDRGLP
jgi:hypothetical protein